MIMSSKNALKVRGSIQQERSGRSPQDDSAEVVTRERKAGLVKVSMEARWMSARIGNAHENAEAANRLPKSGLLARKQT